MPKFRIPLDVDAPREARAAIDALTRGCPSQFRFAARLCVTELVSNCVLHTGVVRGSELRLTAELDNERLTVELRHPGKGFVPRLRDPGADAHAGRGLLIVDAVADAWGAAPDRGQIWFELELAGGAEAAHARAPERARAHR
jgi:anti-sigma regulatory factor (Ser/Thr protein kinase)